MAGYGAYTVGGGFIRDRYYGLKAYNFYMAQPLYAKYNIGFEIRISGLNSSFYRKTKDVEKNIYEYILSQNNI